jgi:tetratricopeptide (TPR) repeat protein
MPRLTKKYIENIFRNSDSPDELFDIFRIAINQGIQDSSIYRLLLWNKALSPDEIMMFAEKICKENPEASYQIYNWVGRIFSSTSVYGEHNEKALEYYKKASHSNPIAHEPYIAITKLYNSELNLPRFDIIIKTIEKGLETVDKKSKLCFSISKLYKTKGDIESANAYQKLGEKYQREGR